jgi:peptidoglycan/xylan/chitin deacetylase (PgdA/CDA1 family)
MVATALGFVIVADVGVEGGLSWDQLREVSATGLVEIGSHSHDHVADECLSLAEARAEKARSKAGLEANLDIKVVSYAYPYGAFSARAKRLLQETGTEERSAPCIGGENSTTTTR